MCLCGARLVLADWCQSPCDSSPPKNTTSVMDVMMRSTNMGEKTLGDDNFLKPLAEVLFLLHFSNTSPLSIAYDRKQSEKLKIHQRTKIFNDQPSCQVFLEILGILVKGSERSRKRVIVRHLCNLGEKVFSLFLEELG